MLGESEDVDADDDEVTEPSRRWSGRGPGEAVGSLARECRLDWLLMSFKERGSMMMAPLWM